MGWCTYRFVWNSQPSRRQIYVEDLDGSEKEEYMRQVHGASFQSAAAGIDDKGLRSIFSGSGDEPFTGRGRSLTRTITGPCRGQPSNPPAPPVPDILKALKTLRDEFMHRVVSSKRYTKVSCLGGEDFGTLIGCGKCIFIRLLL